MFPQCSSPTPHDNGIYVPVHASVYEGPLGTASSVRVVQGMTLWIALIIHMALCETYVCSVLLILQLRHLKYPQIRFTETSNYSRHGFVLEHRDYNEKSWNLVIFARQWLYMFDVFLNLTILCHLVYIFNKKYLFGGRVSKVFQSYAVRILYTQPTNLRNHRP